MTDLPLQMLWRDGNILYIMLSAMGYRLLERATSETASRIWKKTWNRLSQTQRTEWISKSVSLANALIVCMLSLVFLLSPPASHPGPSSPSKLVSPSLSVVEVTSPSYVRLFAFSEAEARILILACGYFFWDVIDSWQNSTWAFVIHGVACLAVYAFSFTPFCAYYGPIFLLFELSTPFLNFRWWMDKMGWEKTHPTLVKLNDLAFALAFLGARIIWGTYQSINFWRDMISQYGNIPTHLFLIYGSSNIALSLLNYHWFSKIAGRAIGGGKKKRSKKPLATLPDEAKTK